MRAFGLILGCAFGLSWTAVAVCDEAAAGEAWETLFRQSDPAGAEKQIAAVLSACGRDAEEVRALIGKDRAYPAREPGWHRQTAKVSEGSATHEFEFAIRVPKGYTSERSWPVLLAAHGEEGGGESSGRIMEALLQADRERYILVAPTVPESDGVGISARQEQAYLVPLRWLRLNLNVDDDRVYISGYRRGGSISWHMATMFPRVFAAAVPMAGAPVFRATALTFDMYLENLSHVPVWAIWGEKDVERLPAIGAADLCRPAAAKLKKLGNKNFKGTELPGKGAEGCLPTSADFVAYLASHKRVAMPAKFQHLFHQEDHARGYYLEAMELAWQPFDFSKRIRIEVPFDQHLSKAELREKAREQIAKHLFCIEAELDRAGNALTVRTKGVRKLRLYVLDGMFDLSRQQTVRYGRRTWRGRIPASAECMLRHYAATRDQTARVVNEMDLNILGKAAVRYK